MKGAHFLSILFTSVFSTSAFSQTNAKFSRLPHQWKSAPKAHCLTVMSWSGIALEKQ